MDGKGGDGRGNAYYRWGCGGGAGNPGGSPIAEGNAGANGTGGLLVIYASEFSNKKVITSNGSAGGGGYRGGGGGSGGGSINIFYIKNTSDNNTSSITASGGAAGPAWRVGESNPGAVGGSGTITKGKIENGRFIKE